MAEHTAFYPDRERRHQPVHDFTDAFAGLHDVERKAEELQPLTVHIWKASVLPMRVNVFCGPCVQAR